MTAPGNHESWCRNPICAVQVGQEMLSPPLDDADASVQTWNFTAYKYKFQMPGNASGSGTTMLWSMDYYNMHIGTFSCLLFSFMDGHVAERGRAVGIDTEQDYPGRPLDPTPAEVLAAGLKGDAEMGEQESYLQLNWLKADLEKANQNRANVPWILIFGHRPIYTASSNNGGSGNNVPTGVRAALQVHRRCSTYMTFSL